MTIQEQITAKRMEVDDKRLSFRIAEDELAELVRREEMEKAKSPFREWMEHRGFDSGSGVGIQRKHGWNAGINYLACDMKTWQNVFLDDYERSKWIKRVEAMKEH